MAWKVSYRRSLSSNLHNPPLSRAPALIALCPGPMPEAPKGTRPGLTPELPPAALLRLYGLGEAEGDGEAEGEGEGRKFAGMGPQCP